MNKTLKSSCVVALPLEVLGTEEQWDFAWHITYMEQEAGNKWEQK